VLILELAVILIGVLSVLTAVAVVALIRQVGVLHLRIQPVAGVTGAGGPAYGSGVKLPADLAELTRRKAERFVVGFLSPTCGVCGPLTSAFGRIARSAGPDTGVLLVIDASQPEADSYVRAKGVSFLPYIADTASFAANVPGAPWAIVTDGSGMVIVSGGVNTLDNVEEMLAQADELMANPPPPRAAAAHSTLTQPVEINRHVL
jgi:hypothetical protein